MSAQLSIPVNLMVDDAHTRTAQLILHLCAPFTTSGGRVDLSAEPLTPQKIANMAGANRQTAGQI